MPTIEEVNLLAAKFELDRVNKAIETGDLSLLKPPKKREREYRPKPKPLSREERRRITLADGQTFADVQAFIEACGIHISQLDKLLWAGYSFNRIAVRYGIMAHAFGQDAPDRSNVAARYGAGAPA